MRGSTLALSQQPADLTAITRETVEELRQLAPERGITLYLPGTLVPVLIDGERIKQVITNYLTNALKYSPDEMPIEVRLSLLERQVCLVVRDVGPGIAREAQARIWNGFQRAAASKQPGAARDAGPGLGPSISRTIIQQHGGQVGLTSEPGQDATFRFLLPLAAEPPLVNEGTAPM